jgi:hypothetical protein
MHSICLCHVKQSQQYKKAARHKSDMDFHDPFRDEAATFPTYQHQMIGDIIIRPQNRT